jgi:branched-chain amino acid transport system substrate-binding protein
MTSRYGARSWARRTLLVCLGAGLWIGATLNARAADPVKIGFSVSLTGGLASSGKAHLLSKQIWAEEVNAKGGLLGRPVQLVYYDDQTNASTADSAKGTTIKPVIRTPR